MSSLRKEIRKLLMAGLGAAAEGVEKGDALLERFAEKGEDTLKQGRIKNEELKHTIRETIRGVKEEKSLMDAVEKMDAGQLQTLKAQIEKLEKQAAAKAAEDAASEEDEAEEAAADAPEETKEEAEETPTEE